MAPLLTSSRSSSSASAARGGSEEAFDPPASWSSRRSMPPPPPRPVPPQHSPPDLRYHHSRRPAWKEVDHQFHDLDDDDDVEYDDADDDYSADDDDDHHQEEDDHFLEEVEEDSGIFEDSDGHGLDHSPPPPPPPPLEQPPYPAGKSRRQVYHRHDDDDDEYAPPPYEGQFFRRGAHPHYPSSSSVSARTTRSNPLPRGRNSPRSSPPVVTATASSASSTLSQEARFSSQSGFRPPSPLSFVEPHQHQQQQQQRNMTRSPEDDRHLDTREYRVHHHHPLTASNSQAAPAGRPPKSPTYFPAYPPSSQQSSHQRHRSAGGGGRHSSREPGVRTGPPRSTESPRSTASSAEFSTASSRPGSHTGSRSARPSSADVMSTSSTPSSQGQSSPGHKIKGSSKRTNKSSSKLVSSASPSSSSSLEAWRKPGRALRQQLLEQDEREQGGGALLLSNDCPITSYFEVADKVLEQFLQHPVDDPDDLLEAYLVGTRLRKFLSLVLPTHAEYMAESIRPARQRSQEQLTQVMQYVDQMATMIDQHQHQLYISRVLGHGPEASRSFSSPREEEEDEDPLEPMSPLEPQQPLSSGPFISPSLVANQSMSSVNNTTISTTPLDHPRSRHLAEDPWLLTDSTNSIVESEGDHDEEEAGTMESLDFADQALWEMSSDIKEAARPSQAGGRHHEETETPKVSNQARTFDPYERTPPPPHEPSHQALWKVSVSSSKDGPETFTDVFDPPNQPQQFRPMSRPSNQDSALPSTVTRASEMRPPKAPSSPDPLAAKQKFYSASEPKAALPSYAPSAKDWSFSADGVSSTDRFLREMEDQLCLDLSRDIDPLARVKELKVAGQPTHSQGPVLPQEASPVATPRKRLTAAVQVFNPFSEDGMESTALKSVPFDEDTPPPSAEKSPPTFLDFKESRSSSDMEYLEAQEFSGTWQAWDDKVAWGKSEFTAPNSRNDSPSQQVRQADDDEDKPSISHRIGQGLAPPSITSVTVKASNRGLVGREESPTSIFDLNEWLSTSKSASLSSAKAEKEMDQRRKAHLTTTTWSKNKYDALPSANSGGRHIYYKNVPIPVAEHRRGLQPLKPFKQCVRCLLE